MQYCEMALKEDDYFVDFAFDIIDVKKKLMGGFIVECAASDEGNNVGFSLEIKNNMSGISNNDLSTFHTYPDGMKMIYKSGLSDNFISSVLRLYGFMPVDLKLKESSYIECGALSGNPMNLKQEEVDFKCFVEVNNENKYAEFYINIDLPNKKLYFKEKDPGYRENIIRYLSM